MAILQPLAPSLVVSRRPLTHGFRLPLLLGSLVGVQCALHVAPDLISLSGVHVHTSAWLPKAYSCWRMIRLCIHLPIAVSLRVGDYHPSPSVSLSTSLKPLLAGQVLLLIRK